MNNDLTHLAESYNSNKILRVLVKFMPKGGIVDNLLSSFYTKEKERRVTSFFDELSKNETALTEEIISSDDFLHKYFITLKAVIETKRTEKIKYFARLLNNSDSPIFNADTDNFEDFIKILDDLTFQELQILSIIRKYDKEIIENGDKPIDFDRKMSKARSFYQKLKTDISKHLQIPEDEVRSLLTKLERTGCIFYNKGSADAMSSVLTTLTYQKLEMLSQID